MINALSTEVWYVESNCVITIEPKAIKGKLNLSYKVLAIPKSCKMLICIIGL